MRECAWFHTEVYTKLCWRCTYLCTCAHRCNTLTSMLALLHQLPRSRITHCWFRDLLRMNHSIHIPCTCWQKYEGTVKLCDCECIIYDAQSYINNTHQQVLEEAHLRGFDRVESVSRLLEQRQWERKREGYSITGSLTSGKFNSLTLQVGMLKNTTSGGMFSTSGNRIETSIISSLPPYSRYTEIEALNLTTEEKFKWFEYYKFKFSLKHYNHF